MIYTFILIGLLTIKILDIIDLPVFYLELNSIL
jgi:hypothetical protein